MRSAAGYNLLFDDTNIDFHVDTETDFSESGCFEGNSNKFGNTVEVEEKADTDDTSKITEKDDPDDIAETAEIDEAEYLEKDVIRKFQIDYDHSVCLSDKFAEAFHIEADTAIESQQHLSFAPGEGKLPENILSSEHWDALAFPMKHPDGNNNLHQKREVKLRDQYYFA